MILPPAKNFTNILLANDIGKIFEMSTRMLMLKTFGDKMDVFLLAHQFKNLVSQVLRPKLYLFGDSFIQIEFRRWSILETNRQ